MTEADVSEIADASGNSIINPIEKRARAKHPSQINRGALLWIIMAVEDQPSCAGI